MTKYIFIAFSIVFICIMPYSHGQSKIENPGFEDWEPDDPNSPLHEPVEWSSIKTSNHSAAGAAPVVIYRSDDAHTGNYSAYLINKYTGIIDQVATGTMTNGRLHVDPGLDPAKSSSFTDTVNSQWNTPLTKKPDSVIGWYKANPVPGDFPTVKFILHADSNSIPGDSSRWIARAAWKGERSVVVNQWTRFSVPFDYYLPDTPEYILSVITAGNGLYALEDSEAWFDDLELIYNTDNITERKITDFNAYFVDGELIVNFDGYNLNNAKISIVDMNGRIVYKRHSVSTGENIIRLILNSGVYIVKLSTNKNQYSKKIVVQ